MVNMYLYTVVINGIEEKNFSSINQKNYLIFSYEKYLNSPLRTMCVLSIILYVLFINTLYENIIQYTIYCIIHCTYLVKTMYIRCIVNGAVN